MTHKSYNNSFRLQKYEKTSNRLSKYAKNLSKYAKPDVSRHSGHGIYGNLFIFALNIEKVA
jgi:hypothetical protein